MCSFEGHYFVRDLESPKATSNRFSKTKRSSSLPNTIFPPSPRAIMWQIAPGYRNRNGLAMHIPLPFALPRQSRFVTVRGLTPETEILVKKGDRVDSDDLLVKLTVA
jgi:hypothetical protein